MRNSNSGLEESAFMRRVEAQLAAGKAALGLRNSQIQWAAEHDWFIADWGNGMIKCRGDDGGPCRFFSDWQALRAWAGY